MKVIESKEKQLESVLIKRPQNHQEACDTGAQMGGIPEVMCIKLS